MAVELAIRQWARSDEAALPPLPASTPRACKMSVISIARQG